MKKILFIITLCVVCATSYGQDVPDYNDIYRDLPPSPSWDLLKHCSKYNRQEYLQLPNYIRSNYEIGKNCIMAGNILVICHFRTTA